MSAIMYYDLHLHSCLSPCASEDMTPYNMAAMCALAGLQVVAITDHNSAGNARAFCQAAEEFGLLALAGMELCTAEEVHVICLFSTVEQAEACSLYIHRTILFQNDPAIFGRQLLMDARETVLGEESTMLIAASGVGIYDVPALMKQYGGVAFPAHIDKATFSLISNLGFYDPAMGFARVEYSPHRPADFFLQHPNLQDMPALYNSDAHALNQIQDAHHSMHLEERSAEAVLRWIAGGCP